MKKLSISLLLLLVALQLQAQDTLYENGTINTKDNLDDVSLQESLCYFSARQISRKGEVNYLKTEPIMVDELTTPIRGRLIDFSLIRVKEQILLEVSIQEDSEESILPVCIGTGASIKFHLRNGKKISLPQFGEKKCGSRNVESDNYYNISNQGFFLIDEKNAQELKKAEVYLSEFSSKSYEFTFVFRSELYDEVNDLFIYPELYFMSELDCVLNPVERN
jgi:hypothetical protein